MRCLSCNVILTDKEATRKYASSGTFIDLCDNCFKDIEEEVSTLEGNNYGKSTTDTIEPTSEDEGRIWADDYDKWDVFRSTGHDD